MRPFRILMNAVDGGGGGGSPPAPAPPAPLNDPPAQPAVVQLDDATRRAIVADARDSFFAEARRSGLLPTNGNRQPAAAARPESPATPTPASTPSVDPVALRGLDRALTRSGRAPSEAAYRRLERDFTAESPADPDAWLTDYFSGFGTSPTAAPVAAAAAATTPPQLAPIARPAGPPVSDRGAPPPPAVALEQQDLISMSPSDRDALVKLKGGKWFSDALTAQMKANGTRIVVRR